MLDTISVEEDKDKKKFQTYRIAFILTVKDVLVIQVEKYIIDTEAIFILILLKKFF